MASHSLAIAKASFSASMMRPDPTPVPRMDIARFHTVLEALLRKCSPANIELCRDWLQKNATSSTTRTVATGKYLVTLASAPGNPADKGTSTSKETISSPRSRQVHMLYLINDLLHHTKYHVDSPSAYSTLSGNLQSCLVDLAGAASTYDLGRYPNFHRKIQDLLRLWDQKHYYESSYINKLRVAVAKSASLGDSSKPKPVNGRPDHELIETSVGKQDAPYIMPASHGDSTTPYYDLPAGNLLPHIIPNSTVPINPQQVRPLQFVARSADESLISAVKNFLKEVDSCGTIIGSDEEGIEMDIDEMGQPMIRNEGTGEFVRGEGYYGWSKAFCERMKRRRDGTEIHDESARRSDSMDRSSSPHKRRRYSSSGSSRRSSSSRSLSRSPRHRSRTRSPFWQQSSSYSPPPVVSLSQEPRPVSMANIAAPLPPPSHASSRPLPGPFPYDLTRGFPLGPGGLPIPPPPPNYKGPWPPPPPPLPPGGGPLAQGNSYPNFPPFVPPPPPPPPPPTGPGGFSSGASPPLPYIMNAPQGQIPHNSGGWVPQKYSGFPASANQPPYSGNFPSGRGSGHRGGWG